MDPSSPERIERVWAEFLSVLDALPPTTRAVFLMNALFDAGCDDVERTLGVHPHACRCHLARARLAVHGVRHRLFLQDPMP